MIMKKQRFKSISDEIENRKDIISFLDSSENIEKLFDIPSSISNDRLLLYKKLYNGIGSTPCYTVNLPNDNILHIKMEYANSMGNNHYSRCWIPYLFIAETLGVIKPGESHLIEVSSGSSGISLSMAVKYLDYKLTLVIPEMLPEGRIAPMKHYGADVIAVPGYIDKCISALRRLIVQNKYFPCNHSEELSDILVKVDKRIASEYYNNYNLPEFCIAGLGNGTSTLAVFDFFKSVSAKTFNITYHPNLKEKDIVFGLYGTNVNLRHVDPALSISDEIIITTGMDLNIVLDYFKYDTEICNLGISSLYGILIALEKSKNVKEKTFFTIGYDKKDRYK